MITRENFEKLLNKLGFIKEENIFYKKFDNFELKVDFKEEKLIYPKELKVNDKTTSNFSKPENFVVFECIHRLLTIGYNPKHIEIEPKWSLGHDKKSGKADIGIKDNSGKNLVIIECKTYGKEYQKALNITKLDGGQIFSYAANSGCDYIALYTSNEEANFEYFLISLKDNENLLKNKNLKSYKKARLGEYGDPAKALFEVWRDTYNQESIKGLFENNRPYEIEKTKFSMEDLKVVSEQDIKKIYHQFATILRQYNVSSRENAFDKLVNLFLCKIVDEIKNKDDLKFYYKGKMIDDEFSFSDRLQKLYKEGMKEFLGEDITYIENSEIESYFKLFNSETIKEKVLEAVNKLKFFTSNDFAFIDVHNKRLFYQNFEVLLKVVLLFQDITLSKSEENQFLGDLFEGFLDQGIKQNEGQYFTPMPIVKFIVSSLPNKEYSSMCDYACGAGHFLNEFASRYRDAEVVGIEKEYRLSKVSKVSSFMYGNQNIKIIYDDALKKDVVKEKFDLIISNPPYSVKGFLETLREEDIKEFELSEFVDTKQYSTNNSIECFFIEKAKHILKDKGLAAIIVPISVLDKTNSKLFIKTREVILKYFNLKAIVKLPTNTFGKTPTTTIILYLEKRYEKVDLAGNVREIVDKIFNNEFNLLEAFKYKELFDEFIEFMGYDKKAYIDFIKEKYNKKLFENDIFKSYLNNFKKSLKPKDKKEGYKKLRKRFIKLVKEKEADRLYFFILSKLNGKVLVVLSPDKNNEIKKFLGYEWSSAKGNEGIKYLSDTKIEDKNLNEDDLMTLSNITTINNIKTPLYNPKDEFDKTKINYHIKKFLENESFEIDEELKRYIKIYNLVDMLDLREVDFNTIVSLTPKREIEIKTKWELVRLGDVSKLVRGVTYSKKDQVSKSNNKILTADNITLNGELKITKTIYLNDNLKIDEEKRLRKNDVFICLSSGSLKHLGKVAFIKEDLDFYSGGFMGIIRTNSKNILAKYLFEILFMFKKYFEDMAVGANINNLSSSIENLKIPLPPIEIQEKIVKEIEEVEKESEKLKEENEKLKKEIDNIIQMENGKWKMEKIENILEKVKGNTTKIPQNEILEKGKYPVITQESEKLISGYTNIDKPITDLPLIVFGDHSCTFKYVDFPFVRGADGTQLLKPNKNFIPKYFYYILQTLDIPEKNKYTRHMKYLKKLQISLPPLEIQKEIVKKIEKLEEQIKENTKELNSLKAKKEEILKKYL